jgi:putative DNA primase/helicase
MQQPSHNISEELREAQAHHFLTTLYGDYAPGWLTIWLWPTKHTHWFRATNLGNAAEYAVKAAQQCDVYLGVGLRGERLNKGRGEAQDVVAIPGLWMDFDIQHPAHKQRHLPPSLDDVLALIHVIPQPPSILVHSGYGVHAYWLFRELWRFEDPDERQHAGHLLRRLQVTFQAEGKTRGWNLDSTFSLDHVLRIPGTLNHKCPDDPRTPYVIGGQP